MWSAMRDAPHGCVPPEPNHWVGTVAVDGVGKQMLLRSAIM